MALEQAIDKHKATQEAFMRSPAMLYVEHDPMTATKKLFMLPDTVEAMRSLLEHADGNQSVINGLQKAVIDYILQGVGVTNDRGCQFLEFMAKNEQALRILFDETKMETFRNVAADLRRSMLSTQVEPERRDGRFPTSPPKRVWWRLFRR